MVPAAFLLVPAHRRNGKFAQAVSSIPIHLRHLVCLRSDRKGKAEHLNARPFLLSGSPVPWREWRRGFLASTFPCRRRGGVRVAYLPMSLLHSWGLCWMNSLRMSFASPWSRSATSTAKAPRRWILPVGAPFCRWPGPGSLGRPGAVPGRCWMGSALTVVVRSLRRLPMESWRAYCRRSRRSLRWRCSWWSQAG